MGNARIALIKLGVRNESGTPREAAARKMVIESAACPVVSLEERSALLMSCRQDRHTLLLPWSRSWEEQKNAGDDTRGRTKGEQERTTSRSKQGWKGRNPAVQCRRSAREDTRHYFGRVHSREARWTAVLGGFKRPRIASLRPRI